MVRKSIDDGIDDCQTGNIFILALIAFFVQTYYYNPRPCFLIDRFAAQILLHS